MTKCVLDTWEELARNMIGVIDAGSTGEARGLDLGGAPITRDCITLLRRLNFVEVDGGSCSAAQTAAEFDIRGIVFYAQAAGDPTMSVGTHSTHLFAARRSVAEVVASSSDEEEEEEDEEEGDDDDIELRKYAEPAVAAYLELEQWLSGTSTVGGAYYQWRSRSVWFAHKLRPWTGRLFFVPQYLRLRRIFRFWRCPVRVARRG